MEVATAVRALPAQRRVRTFERDCERLRPLGEAFVLRRFGGSLNRADAEDAVSEVLIRLHKRVAEGRAPTNLRAAFFTSVRNAAIDQLRSRAAKPTVALEAAAEAASESASPVECAESREDAVRLQEALQRMRGNYREAIVLRFGLGLTVPEISRHLKISLPAAKKLVLRATQQVKKRLESIEGAEFCPEMRDMARKSLFEKEACGMASEAEGEILRRHFEHCGSCKSFLANLHQTLHEFGSLALVGATAGDHITNKVGLVDHLVHWIDGAARSAETGAGKMRLAAYKASGAFSSADGATAGALAGTSQKVIAICTAGAATTATCLATGVVGPGVGITAPAAKSQEPAAKVKTVDESPAPAPAPEPILEPAPEPAPEPEPAPVSDKPSHDQQSSPSKSPDASSSESAAAPAPVEQSHSEFGIEGGSSPAPAPAPAPAPSPSPAPSSGSSLSGSGSGGGGGSGGSTSSGGGSGGASSGGGSIGFDG
jgi:RNA polymerase sigma factor (sigma-70 family)